jgi:hypothetical protein
MLLESDRKKLEALIKERLRVGEGGEGGEGQSGEVCYVTGTFDDGSGSRPEGMLAVGSKKVAFAAHTVLSGEVWKEWPKDEIEDISIDDELLGAKLTFTADSEAVALERIPKEQAQQLASLAGELVQGGPAQSRQEAAYGAATLESSRTASKAFEDEGGDGGGAEASPEPPSSPVPGAHFPVGLGVDEEWVCASCGRKSPRSYKFCLGCGESVSESAGGGGAVGGGDARGEGGGPKVGFLVGLGPKNPEAVALTDEVCKVGRASTSFLTIQSGSISRIHAIVEGSGPTRTVIDLGSANGTFVNGKRIDKAEIRDGDRVRFGDDYEFLYKWAESPPGQNGVGGPRVSQGDEEWVCASCGKKNPRSYKFCLGCGGDAGSVGRAAPTSSNASPSPSKVMLVWAVVIAIVGVVMAFFMTAS